MYNEVLLSERMAELGLNFYRLAKQAGIDPKTAKQVVTTGRGHPDSVKAVAKILKFTLPQIVKRHNGDRNAHLGATADHSRKR